jgi:hypothetical protein
MLRKVYEGYCVLLRGGGGGGGIAWLRHYGTSRNVVDSILDVIAFLNIPNPST